MNSSQPMLMFSPLLQARIAEIDDEITRFGGQPIELRRQRNSLVPVSSIPTEVITDIFELVVHNDMRIHGKSLTLSHVCSHWRDVMLNCPVLWSSICTTSVEIFRAYLERSGDRILEVDIRPTIDPEHGKAIFQLAMDNMQRVRSLRLLTSSVDWDYMMTKTRGTQAPHLKVLQLPNLAVCPLRQNGDRQIEPIFMPQLQKLELSGTATYFDWRFILPSELPTVSDLTFKYLHYEDELEVLMRCSSVRTLRVSSVSLVPPNPRPLTLSNLVQLQLDDTHDWEFLRYLELPALRRLDFYTSASTNNMLLRRFESWKLLIESTPLWYLTSPERDVSVACCLGKATTVKLEDADRSTLATLSVEFKVCVGIAGWADCVPPELPRFIGSLGLGIHSLDIEDGNEWYEGNFQSTLLGLRGNVNIKTISLRGVLGLLRLLGKPGFDSVETCRARICTCGLCCTIQDDSHPGLKTLLLDDEDGNPVSTLELDSHSIWCSFADWLEKRRERGLELDMLVLTKSQAQCLEPQCLERIFKTITDVVVKDG